MTARPPARPSSQSSIDSRFVAIKEGEEPSVEPVSERTSLFDGARVSRSSPPFIASHDIPRGIAFAIQALLGYALMLAVMWVISVFGLHVRKLTLRANRNFPLLRQDVSGGVHHICRRWPGNRGAFVWATGECPGSHCALGSGGSSPFGLSDCDRLFRNYVDCTLVRGIGCSVTCAGCSRKLFSRAWGVRF